MHSWCPGIRKCCCACSRRGATRARDTRSASILTDDGFSAIVKAVELGRGLYDNLARYVRFQMGCLFGYIIAFLGAAVFNIAVGVPLLPLQTLWVSRRGPQKQCGGHRHRSRHGRPAGTAASRCQRRELPPAGQRRENMVARRLLL